MRFRHDLLETNARLAGRRRLGPIVSGASCKTARRRQNRFFPHGPQRFFNVPAAFQNRHRERSASDREAKTGKRFTIGLEHTPAQSLRSGEAFMISCSRSGRSSRLCRPAAQCQALPGNATQQGAGIFAERALHRCVETHCACGGMAHCRNGFQSHNGTPPTVHNHRTASSPIRPDATSTRNAISWLRQGIRTVPGFFGFTLLKPHCDDQSTFLKVCQ